MNKEQIENATRKARDIYHLKNLKNSERYDAVLITSIETHSDDPEGSRFFRIRKQDEESVYDVKFIVFEENYLGDRSENWFLIQRLDDSYIRINEKFVEAIEFKEPERVKPPEGS